MASFFSESREQCFQTKLKVTCKNSVIAYLMNKVSAGATGKKLHQSSLCSVKSPLPKTDFEFVRRGERCVSKRDYYNIPAITFSFLSLEYERLKKEKEEKTKKDKEDQLKKLKEDVGAGKPVAMETNPSVAPPFESMHATPFHISLGTELDSDDEEEEGGGDEFDEEEIKEHESFKRFLEKEKQRGQEVKKEGSG